MAGLVVLLVMMSYSLVVANQQQIQLNKKLVLPKPTVELTCIAKTWLGVCPITVKMTGTVKAPAAMSLQYYFIRSDGASSTPAPLIFRTRGTKTIPFTWTLSKDYQAWVQLIVKMADKTEIKSVRVYFKVDCDETKKPGLQVAQIDWSKRNRPLLKQTPKFTISQNFFKILNYPGADLVVNRVAPMPKVIHYNQTIMIYVHAGNKGKTAAPACKLSIRLIAQYAHPVHGKIFNFEYDIPALGPGTGGWSRYPFHNFWHGYWRVLVKIDSKNTVIETGRENNNTGQNVFRVY